MTKEQIIETVREYTEKLGHVPSHRELTRLALVSRKHIRWHFGNYTRLMRECKLEKWGGGMKVGMDALLEDWAGIVRDLKKLPSHTEYDQFSKYSVSPLTNRFGIWTQVPFGMKQYIEEQGRTEEMKDVLEVIEAQGRLQGPGKSLRTLRQGPHDVERAGTWVPGEGPDAVSAAGPNDGNGGAEDAEKRPPRTGIYGKLMRYGPMVCEPTNEQGVLFLFGAMAEKLGFALLQIGTAFPDCEVFRVVDGDRLERVKAEIEYESRNFLKHLHDVKGCGLIICWKHNWPECPLPVIELSKAVKDQAFSRTSFKP